MLERFSTLRARVRLTVTVIGLLVFIIFLLQNTETIPVRLLFFDADVPSVVMFLVTGLGGFAMGYYVAFTGGRRRRKRQDAKQAAKSDPKPEPAAQD